MNLIDHTNTMVLLIGASAFPEDASINAIPNVTANLQLLKTCLADAGIIGIPENNITVSLNESKSQIEKKLRDIADKTRNKKFTLLVYYTGHGILSSEDYQLYLTTYFTSKQDLEIDGINIEDFKKYIKKSIAGRKIVILDCCHSGAIIGSMGDMPSKIQSELNDFEGTYVMTSAAEDTPSLFPVESPGQPTYFTGKLLDILNDGLDTENEYCSLRDIYNKLQKDLTEVGLPRPQQSNFNSADQLYFSVNKKFISRKPADELAWEEAARKNTKWSYKDFKDTFPQSVFVKEAKIKISAIEEEEVWRTASYKNTVSSLDAYMDDYPGGKYFAEANARIKELRNRDEAQQTQLAFKETQLWNETIKNNTLPAYEQYIQAYPNGRFTIEAGEKMEAIKQTQAAAAEATKQQKDEEDFWQQAESSNNLLFFEQYLQTYANGKFIAEANKNVERLQEELQAEESKKQKEAEEENLWKTGETINTIVAFQTYIKAYPTGKYIAKAKRKIQALEETARESKRKEEGGYESEFDASSLLGQPENSKAEQPQTTFTQHDEETNYQKNGNDYTKVVIASVAVLLIILFITNYDGCGSSSSYDDTTTDIIDSIAAAANSTSSMDVSAISLLSFNNGNIAEDSLHYYKHYGELADLKDTYGDVFNYKGGVYNALPEGYGIAHYKNGDTYTGHYISGKKYGKGAYNLKSGDKYEGDFVNDKEDGRGTFTWKDGDIYSGDWKGGGKSGTGTYIWPDGTKYVGSWFNGKENGYGELSAPAGRQISNCADCAVYKGYFKDDKMNGEGKCYDENGKLLYDGPFKNNKPANTYPSQ